MEPDYENKESPHPMRRCDIFWSLAYVLAYSAVLFGTRFLKILRLRALVIVAVVANENAENADLGWFF